MQVQTQTATYTVVDIQKTFGSFEADLRMIARRTGKLTQIEVEKYCHDVLIWAEGRYLNHVDIILTEDTGKVIQAARYTVNADGSAMTGDRAGGNDWPTIAGSSLSIVVQQNSTWTRLDEIKKQSVYNNLQLTWGATNIDTSYTHLQRSAAQGYASRGYELNKENFK